MENPRRENPRAAEFADYFDKVRGRTLRVAKCIPAEKLEWTFRPGRFTLGDLLRHLAGTERYMWGENARFAPSRYPGHGRELADGVEAVFAYVDRLHAESMEIFASLSDADLEKKCATADGATITLWKWLRLMAEHEIHHRGQIYLYLALLEVPTPPLYGLTEEQVRERSRA
ncbi:MAG: DinB family protein [Bryobacteraceae bacterium]